MATSTRPSRGRATSTPMSSKATAQGMDDFKMSSKSILRYFDPTAATASMFLYAQGNSVVCCHHDTLTIERRFSRHSDEVQILAVDNQSELGAGRLVVSYDAGQTAIVWDIMSGEEVARFASYEHLTVAAWMRNGNVAFGNTQGNIILFEPTTSEHISARTIDQIAVTALAPSADCRTFAIGYQNGSLLIATLQPRFTILHNLTTSRGPSPIVTLNWHASSSRQKSDMLAVQTNDGDLRVWSVSKAYNSADPAKVVRILKKSENFLTGANWMSWSKNGRIIQYCESETLSWDVRTKHVTYDKIPTLEHIKGLAVYGPGASLFTLGANNTVQQFDLNAPAMMVANVQHPANLLPPSPPVSIEEQEKGAATASDSEIRSDSEMGSIQISADISESDDDPAPPMARIARAGTHNQSSDEDLYRTASPASSRSAVSDMSSTSSRTPGRYQGSVQSRGLTENTYISAGSSIRSSAMHQERMKRESSSLSTSSLSSISMGSSTSRARHRPSRLRHEVPRSPEDSRVADLFKFTRSRLSDVPYKRPPMTDNSRLTNDDLRRQMLCTIFGWTKEAEDLVRDEMSRHPLGTPARILLAKWLGDIDQDILATSSENMTSSDWMLLALSGIGGTAAQHKLGLAVVQRLLENGDIHSAVTIMIGMGETQEAIEVYISHKKYLEALIMSCLFYPSVWERQSQIVKKWGEWAVLHGHQQLAIRCFACTGKESSEPWSSPSAQQVTFQSINTAVNPSPSIPEILSPPLSPPGLNRGPQRSIAKTSALKLITSFGEQNSKSKFFSSNDGGQTPIAAGVTPIAESAISPRGDDMNTAFLKPSNRSAFNTPTTARSQTSNFSRGRLPSIGEMPSDHNLRNTARVSAKPAPGIDALTPPSDSPARSGHAAQRSTDEGHLIMGMALQRAATASPMMMRDTHRIRDAPPPSPGPESQAAIVANGRRSRNGPRERMPSGLELQLQSLDNASASDVTSPEQSVQSARFHWPTRRRGPGSITSSTATSASAASSIVKPPRGQHGGKSLDDYINSLEAAKLRSRGGSREGRHKARDGSRTRHGGGSRERSGERGRTSSRGYTPRAGKRSPTSPVPMSPEDLLNLSTPKFHEGGRHEDPAFYADQQQPPGTVRKASTVRASSRSRTRQGGASSSTTRGERRLPALEIPGPAARGRSHDRQDPGARSPSSPLPMSAGGIQHFYGSEDEEDYRRAKEEQARFRSKKAQSRGGSKSREPSPGGASSSSNPLGRDVSESRRPHRNSGDDRERARTPGVHFVATSGHAGDLRAMKDERQLKKEAAARELEERRKSLAKRPLAPSIPHPDELSPALPGMGMGMGMGIPPRAPTAFELPSTTFVPAGRELPPRSRTAEPERRTTMTTYSSQPQHQQQQQQQPTRPVIGLPATPKAMRLVMEGQKDLSPEEPLPPIPLTFAQATSPNSTSSRQNSPQKENHSPRAASAAGGAGAGAAEGLTLLPSTVYQPPSRPTIQRCMSAPPEDPVAPQALQGGGGSSSGSGSGSGSGSSNQATGRLTRGQSLRKISAPESHSNGYKRTIDGVMDDAHIGRSSMTRRPSYGSDNKQHTMMMMIPPPPPPPPPMLKELAHLAIPPPPPPAPLPFAPGGGGGSKATPVVYGGKTSGGTIEVVTDNHNHHNHNYNYNNNSNDDNNNHVVVPLAETTVPVIAPPAPPSSRGHHRGRSSVDNSLAGRISRATERLRSSSRSRNNNSSSSGVNRTKSPVEGIISAPYESIQVGGPGPGAGGSGSGGSGGGGPPVSFHNRELRSPIDGRPLRDLPTGMGPGDLI